MKTLFTNLIAVKITEAKIANLVFTLTPWIAPLVTVWLVYDATRAEPLSWGVGKALLGAAVVDLIGYSSIYLLLWLYRERAKRELIAIAYGIVGTYIVSILALTVLLELAPSLAAGVPVVFVLLTVAGYVTVTIRTHHKVTKADERQPKTPKVVESKAKVNLTWPKLSESHKKAIAGMTVDEIIAEYGKSERTAQNWYKWARDGHKEKINK